MISSTIFGIYREKSHSPQREFDDTAILKATSLELEKALNQKIILFEPDEFLKAEIDFSPRLIFFMCEEAPYLEKLKRIEAATGCKLVNTIEGVENTFRENMVALFEKVDFFPKSRILSVNEEKDYEFSLPLWFKRGDYHAIETEDVIFAKYKKDVSQALDSFLKRKIDKVVIQEHIPGDIIKFYCVRDSSSNRDYWFKWFYHKDQNLREYPFSRAELYQKVKLSGEIMDLEIYGGDAIVRPDGEIFIIDVNAWPSFALFRKEASFAISTLLLDKLSTVNTKIELKCLDGKARSIEIST